MMLLFPPNPRPSLRLWCQAGIRGG